VIISRLIQVAWLSKYVPTSLELNWCDRLKRKNWNGLWTSAQVVDITQCKTRRFIRWWLRNVQNTKNARAKSAKLLSFGFKYANLFTFLCSCALQRFGDWIVISGECGIAYIGFELSKLDGAKTMARLKLGFRDRLPFELGEVRST